ncbi:MAG TPA: MSMEG_0565 family glycosyltransferase [Acidimicrobiia bacterium]|nr:MSMEG_0565 family glycosyltransferase [Acidimicrobiia bacterium]
MRRVILVSHSTRPRGGLVHTLFLAEALHRLGHPVRVVALGDPAAGLFRDTPVAVTVAPAPPPAPTLEERVFEAVDALEEALRPLVAGAEILHAQDCIAARAAARIRDGWSGPAPAPSVVRTVHHVDDFTTAALVECQRRAILDPDRLLVVSREWQQILAEEYGVAAAIVRNGVDPGRFAPITDGERARLRSRVGAGDGRFLVLTVGGIEPRKGTVALFEAMGELKRTLTPAPVLGIVGGHSFQDYRAYRDDALARLPGLGLEMGSDVVLLGTVPDDELGGWYGAADAFAFPSVKEGFGLVVLEALAAGLPVVATDIPVFAEYLTDGESALLVPPGAPAALASALASVIRDPGLRRRLVEGGRPVVDRFTWEATATQHLEVYALLDSPSHRRSA